MIKIWQQVIMTADLRRNPRRLCRDRRILDALPSLNQRRQRFARQLHEGVVGGQGVNFVDSIPPFERNSVIGATLAILERPIDSMQSNDCSVRNVDNRIRQSDYLRCS